MTTTPHPKRRPRRFLQFSLRSLLVFVLLVSIGMSWLGVRLERARRQREAVEAIRAAGGGVHYDYEWENPSGEPSVPKWASAFLGHDFFYDAVEVTVCPGDFSDEEAVYLKRLTKLEMLYLYGTQITDAGVTHLERLTGLAILELIGTQVTPEGVKKLQEALPECQIFYGE